MLINRRGVLGGIGSLLATPGIVKASSLMPLRGIDMDPLMLGYQHEDGTWALSGTNFIFKTLNDKKRWMHQMKGIQLISYELRRQSELISQPPHLGRLLNMEMRKKSYPYELDKLS